MGAFLQEGEKPSLIEVRRQLFNKECLELKEQKGAKYGAEMGNSS
jgi:hypothetical protein